MPTDTFYGSESELRIGFMPTPTTDPSAWHTLEFLSLTVSPQRERRDRPKLGSPRHNVLDPIKPVPGFFRLSADLRIDADSRQLAQWLTMGLGAPANSGAGPYTHVWSTGGQSPNYFALQVRTASNEVRIYRGFTIASIGLNAAGENTQDFDVTIGLRGQTRERASAFLSGTVAAVPVSAPMLRALYKIDGVAASNMLSASWSWDRGIVEDTFLSPTPTISGLRAGSSSVSGSASVRAVAAVYDELEEDDTVFASMIDMIGTISGHAIKWEAPTAMLSAPPLSIDGPGLIERTLAYVGHQTTSTPAGRITIVNEIASYG